jgi:hypothetical protein
MAVNRLTTLAFERGLAAIALNVHLQDRGVVHESMAASVMVLSAKISPIHRTGRDQS